jgi:hypothetical protein
MTIRENLDSGYVEAQNMLIFLTNYQNGILTELDHQSIQFIPAFTK